MAYKKQGFVNGMILKAENLVKIEEGIIEAEESVEASVQDALEEAKESGEFDGKSAYQYAQEGGFTGTEATFSERLARGNIHIGTDAPADGSEVWIDTDEEPTSGGSEEPTGGGSIDVTAEVGQTIIVKEVDENGKPTKWESADYQPRTHWSEFREVQPSTAITPFYYEALGVPMGNMSNFDIVAGNKYKVTFDGVEYTCEAFIGSAAGVTAPGFGNTYVFGGANTGEPFAIFKVPGDTWTTIIFFDMNPHTVQVFAETATPIPAQYLSNALPYYIEVTGSGTDDDPYVCNDTVANVEAMYNSGRDIQMKYGDWAQTHYMHLCYSVVAVTGNGTSFSPYGTTFCFRGNGYYANAPAFVLWLYPLEDGTYSVSKTLSE